MDKTPSDLGKSNLVSGEDQTVAEGAQHFSLGLPLSNHLVIAGGGSSSSDLLVKINLDDGTITFGDGYDPDEAARLFWSSVSDYPRQLERRIAELEALVPES